MEVYTRVHAIVLCYLSVGCRFGLGLVGKLHGSVELPCVYHPLPAPLEKVTVYWQKKTSGKSLVVATVIDGKVDMEYVNEKFRGRAHFNPDQIQNGDFNLSLTNLSLYDKGFYDCIIMWSAPYEGNKPPSTVELSVTAEFSTPVVYDVPSTGKQQVGLERSVTCSSHGELEQPRIMWINASDQREIQDGRVHEYVHHEEDKINVTSTITLNITSDINISCVIVTKYGNMTSQPVNMKVTQENTSSPQVLIVFIIIGGLVGGIIIALLIRWRQKRRPPHLQSHRYRNARHVRRLSQEHPSILVDPVTP